MKRTYFYKHKHNSIVDSSGKQIAVVLPSNCTMREARAMAAFAAQQMNHELRAKKLNESNTRLDDTAAAIDAARAAKAGDQHG